MVACTAMIDRDAPDPPWVQLAAILRSRIATEQPLAGGLAFLDLEDEVSYGREGEVWAVAEDGVARTGKLHQAGGLRRQSAD
jgi:hypothetical protein